MTETTARKRARTSRSGWIVLQEIDEDTWRYVGTRSERSHDAALRKALEAAGDDVQVEVDPLLVDPNERRWVAVPVDDWRPRTLQARTVLDFVEDDEA
jgi:hypothetical protein